MKMTRPKRNTTTPERLSEGAERKDEDREGGRAPPTETLGLYAAKLRCDNCGRPTLHRIVHWKSRNRTGGKRLEGLARCRECGGTHPFEVRPVEQREFDLIVSSGAVSERRRVRRPSSERVTVGSPLPGEGPPLEVRKIVRTLGDSVHDAPVAELATVWAVPRTEHRLPVSIIEGARTRSALWAVDPESALGVGDRVEVDGIPIRLTAVRARGRTWRFPGERFPAREIQRLYGRRSVSPPAGRRDWSTGRGIPRSRESSTSRFDRSRSSPGVRRTRTTPRRRTASGGATVQRVSPS